jgi:hypothetical protein
MFRRSRRTRPRAAAEGRRLRLPSGSRRHVAGRPTAARPAPPSSRLPENKPKPRPRPRPAPAPLALGCASTFSISTCRRPDRAEAGRARATAARLLLVAGGREDRSSPIFPAAARRRRAGLQRHEGHPGPARRPARRGEDRRHPPQARGPAALARLRAQRQAGARGRPDRLRRGVAASPARRPDDGFGPLDFEGDEPVELLLERAGRMPLPPYIAGRAKPTRATARITRRCSRARKARSPRRPPRSISRRG